MPSYDASISITAPRQSVWRVLSAVSAWPEWLPTVNSVQPLDAGPLALASRYTVHQPKLRPTTWVVTELEPPRRFVWQARSPGLVMVAEHTVEEISSDNCSVVLRFSFSGVLGTTVAWLYRSVTERYLAQEVASLKITVEGQRK